MFQIERLSEPELQQQLELAKDDLAMKVKKSSIFLNIFQIQSKENSEVWWNDLQEIKGLKWILNCNRSGLSMNNLLKSGKSEQFAANRTLSRLHEMHSRSYWLQ